MISLINDAIDSKDMELLIAWLKTNPRLTKGILTEKFEEKWSKWLGVKHSVFVNSGSAANMLMLYSILASIKIRNKKVIVPTVSWSTTVSPIIQLGLSPVLCESDINNLGMDLNHLESLCKKHNPSIVMYASILGIPSNMDALVSICDKHGALLLEDTCESTGSLYKKKKVGTFGLESSFSFFYGHHMSTIEGGMVCTNNEAIYNTLKIGRASCRERV